MVCHSRHGRRDFLFLLLLSFSISAYGRDAGKILPSSGAQNTFRFYSPEAVLVDLDGDHTPDFVAGQRLGQTTEGYFYRVQLQLRSGASSSFTVFHDNSFGLKITGVDIDGDNDVDLIISDKFLHQCIGIWLNDGTGRFVKSVQHHFSPNSVSDLAFVTVDLKWAGQPAVDKQQRRLPDYHSASAYIPFTPRRSSALKPHPVEWLFHFSADPVRQRAPPTSSAV